MEEEIHMTQIKTFSQFLMKEEGITPTNIAGSGAIAGIPPDPTVVVKKKKLNIMKRKLPKV